MLSCSSIHMSARCCGGDPRSRMSLAMGGRLTILLVHGATPSELAQSLLGLGVHLHDGCCFWLKGVDEGGGKSKMGGTKPGRARGCDAMRWQ